MLQQQLDANYQHAAAAAAVPPQSLQQHAAAAAAAVPQPQHNAAAAVRHLLAPGVTGLGGTQLGRVLLTAGRVLQASRLHAMLVCFIEYHQCAGRVLGLVLCCVGLYAVLPILLGYSSVVEQISIRSV